MAPLVWLITGTSSGLGYQLALEALNRGEKVIATARAQSINNNLDGLKSQGADILELDVTSSVEILCQVAPKAIAIYGRIDVLVNNAGYVQSGTLEEVNSEETYNQYNTHIFGSLNVSRAFLPYMRENRSGTIVFIGSICGHTWRPAIGVYASTKWALRSISLTMNEEIKHLGLRTTCIDFGDFRTPILEKNRRGSDVFRIADYKEISEAHEAGLQADSGNQRGDPKVGANVVIDIVRGEGSAAGKPFPTSLCLGADCYTMVKSALEMTLEGMETWKDVSCSTDIKD